MTFTKPYKKKKIMSYKWGTESLGIKNMHELSRRNFNIFYKKYKAVLNKKNSKRKNKLIKEAKKILLKEINNKYSFYRVFSGVPAHKVETYYFNGSYKSALQKSFPELNLIELNKRTRGRKYVGKWETVKKGKKNIQDIAKVRMKIFYQKYITGLKEKEKDKKRQLFKKAKKILLQKIKNFNDFAEIFTTAPVGQGCFKSSYKSALQKSFPELNLIELDRQKRSKLYHKHYTTEKKIIKFMHHIAKNKLKQFYKKYLTGLNEKDKDMKKQILMEAKELLLIKIKNAAGFLIIFTGSPLCVPYFNHSYLIVLQKLFPELHLKKIDIIKRRKTNMKQWCVKK